MTTCKSSKNNLHCDSWSQSGRSVGRGYNLWQTVEIVKIESALRFHGARPSSCHPRAVRFFSVLPPTSAWQESFPRSIKDPLYTAKAVPNPVTHTAPFCQQRSYPFRHWGTHVSSQVNALGPWPLRRPPTRRHTHRARPLVLIITPRHHCTRMHTALALSHESEWPAVVEVGLETAHCGDHT